MNRYQWIVFGIILMLLPIVFLIVGMWLRFDVYGLSHPGAWILLPITAFLSVISFFVGIACLACGFFE